MAWQFYDDPAKNAALADPFHPDNVSNWVKDYLSKQQPQAAPAQPQKPRGRGGWLSSLISELGGAGGAAGGAATGAAIGSVVPGLGTLIGGALGAGVGGFLGGTGGRVVENKVRDNRVGLGDALKEGALSGAFSLAGGGLQAFKGAKAAKGLTSVLGKEVPVAESAIVKGAGTLDKSGIKLITKNPNELNAYKMTVNDITTALKDAPPSSLKRELGRLDQNMIKMGLAEPTQAAIATTPASTVEKTVAKAVAPRIGMIENKGLGLTSKAGGYFTGATVPGASPLKPSQVKYYDDLLRKLKIPANDATDLVNKIEPRLSEVGKRIENNVLRNNVPLGDVSKFTDDLVAKVGGTPGLGDTATNFARQEAEKIAKITDAKGLINYRKGLDKSISFIANPDAASTEKQGAARVIREALKNKTNDLIPGLSKENNLYHELSNIQDYALAAAKRGNMQDTGGAGLTARILSGPTANTIRAKAGSKLQTVGQLSAGTARGAISGPLSQVTRQAKIQALPNLASALGGAVQPVQDISQPQAQPQAYGGFTGQPPDTFQPTPDAQSQQAQQPQGFYNIDNFRENVANDPKHLTDYLALLKYSDAQVKAAQDSKSGPNIGKTSAAAYGLAQQGLNALGQFSQLVQNDPGVVSRSSTPGRSLPGIGGYIAQASGTNQFDTLGFATISSLLRAQSGAAVPDSEVRAYMKAYLPRAGDKPADIQRKLQTLHYDFQTVLGNASNQNAQDPSLQDVQPQAIY